MRGAKLSAPYLAIATLTLALMIPAMISRPMVHDSFWIDFVWADQFTAEIRRGMLYPRWLPQSHDGLGSPTFYFYPPIGFYIAAIFGLAGAPTYTSIMLAFATALAASGAAIFLWLKGWTERPLLGACFYMVAPYHLGDFYYRGALAECCAFAIIPLVALGMKRCAEGRGFLLLTLAYAALIMSHLPIALLTSVLLVPSYSLWLMRETRRIDILKAVAAGLALGIGIAAIYLFPALALQDYIAAAKLWAKEQFQPVNWSIFNAAHWPKEARAAIFLGLTAFSATAVAVLLIARRSFWELFTLGCCMMVAGIIPTFWSLPLIEKVQFPWRALTLVEFGLATALAASPLRPLFLAIAITPLLGISALFMRPNFIVGIKSLAPYQRYHPDVPEYLPQEATEIEDWTKALEATNLQRSQPPIRVEGDVTIARTFYFPSWRVVCQGHETRPFADPATKLLAYRGKDCTVSLGQTFAERMGIGITLLTAALFGLLVTIRRRRLPSDQIDRVIFTQS